MFEECLGQSTCLHRFCGRWTCHALLLSEHAGACQAGA